MIQDYSPLWPELFVILQSRIALALQGIADSIDHVGSTAVPGLDAKPVIDIDVLLASHSDLPIAIARLASIGYEHEGDLGVTGREAFRAPVQDCPHHLYVCSPGSPIYQAHLAFRDHLRIHKAAADEYALLKRELAAKYKYDRDAYAQAKSSFILKILRRVDMSRASLPENSRFA